MPKSSKKDIDKDIKKIIYELETNSNRSVFDIGNKLGFSRQKTWRLIKDLENNNTIWGYTAIVDDNKISRKRFYILIKRTSLPTPEKKIDSMVKRDIRKETKKSGVHYESSCLVNGLFDALICITAEDIKQVKRFIDSLNKLYGANISDIHILEVLFPVGRGGIDNPNIENLREYL
jgi:DNA-binding Lrp family transcriptional regulator